MSSLLKNLNTQFVLCVFLILIFGLDILNIFEFSKSQPWESLIKTGKSIFYICFLFNCLIITKDKLLITSITTLALFFFIGQLIIFGKPSITSEFISETAPNIRFLILSLFPLIFITFLANNPQLNTIQIRKIFIIIIWITTLSTIIGFVFEIKFLKTYIHRFGYRGLMPKSITATYFYIAAILFLYHAYFFKKHKNLISLLFTVMSALLVGTKAIYLFIAMLFLFHFIYFKFYKKFLTYISLTFLLILFSVFKDAVQLLFIKLFNPLIALYEKSGLLTALFSFRDLIFIENWLIYKNSWTSVNYLLGGKISHAKLYENSVLDIFTFFGIIGTCLFLYVFFKNSLKIIKTNYPFGWFSILSIFTVSILAGQFFINISGATYILIALFLMFSTKTSEKV